MISDRIFIEAQLARLSAAYPSFRMVGPTQELYLQKLGKLDADDLGSAVEFFIEHGKKYPTIGQLIDRAAEAAKFRTRRASVEDRFELERVSRLERPEWGKRFGGPLWAKYFQIGWDRQQAAFSEALDRHERYLAQTQESQS